MEDNDLQEFIELYNGLEDKPRTALEFILAMDKLGFRIIKKAEQQ